MYVIRLSTIINLHLLNTYIRFKTCVKIIYNKLVKKIKVLFRVSKLKTYCKCSLIDLIYNFFHKNIKEKLFIKASF